MPDERSVWPVRVAAVLRRVLQLDQPLALAQQVRVRGLRHVVEGTMGEGACALERVGYVGVDLVGGGDRA